jgi:hypothetical protein
LQFNKLYNKALQGDAIQMGLLLVSGNFAVISLAGNFKHGYRAP